MNIVIVGQGAIGLLCYSQLAIQDQHRMSLLCSTRLKHYPQNIEFIDIENNIHLIPVAPATDDKLSQADVIIFCLKAFDIVSALNNMTTKVPINTPLILAHNGMIDAQLLTDTLKSNYPLLTLLTTHGCKKERPFTIKHTGKGYSELGTISNLQIPPNGSKLSKQQRIALFNALKFMLPIVHWSEDINEKQWKKLAINCVINPITAIENIENGEITSQKYSARIKSILQEVTSIANQQGVSLDFEELEQAALNVAELTAKNCSSMRSDILAKRYGEIDHINGYIAKLGKKHKISTPANTLIWQQIKSLEQAF